MLKASAHEPMIETEALDLARRVVRRQRSQAFELLALVGQICASEEQLECLALSGGSSDAILAQRTANLRRAFGALCVLFPADFAAASHGRKTLLTEADRTIILDVIARGKEGGR